MDIPASHAALLDAPVATLATIDPNGRPQLTAVWFLAEDGVVRISLSEHRHKVRNLRANPAVSLIILDPETPYRTLELRGHAEIAPDPDFAFADRVGAKYGADLREMGPPDDTRVVVTIVAERVTAWGD